MPPSEVGIDALPDEALLHILGFLEAPESVRTCVLARRWRDLWKSATGLRIVVDEGKFLGSVAKLCDFLDRLLRHHQGSPLHTCELTFTAYHRNLPDGLDLDIDDRLQRLVNTWLQHAVRCQVQVLRLNMCTCGFEVPSIALDDRPVGSWHLTTLELDGVVVRGRFLDFSNCPSLERLEFTNCCFKSYNSRFCICAPSLVSLLLAEYWGMIPVLERMASLVKASVLVCGSWDACDLDYCNCEFCDNSYSIHDGSGSDGCVLLKGLSEAMYLTLKSVPGEFIFKRDLRWCPTFSRLKTLLLNDYWCVPDDFRALVCILEHSPVLEKLTLELSLEKGRQQRERKGSLRPMEGSAAISEHLKIIEVRCAAVDERICKLTLFLCAFHIRLSFDQTSN